MDTEAIALIVGAVQVIALAWIAAWQQRAASNVRRLNGTVEAAQKDLRDMVERELGRESTDQEGGP